MHELGVTRSIVDVVLRNACSQQAKQVLSVSLVIGEMRNLEEEWVQRYFDRCAKGTLAEGAKIKIQKVPMAFYCNDCGSTFQLAMGSDRHMCCPIAEAKTTTWSPAENSLSRKSKSDRPTSRITNKGT